MTRCGCGSVQRARIESAAEAIKRAGGRAVAVSGDVTEAHAVEHVVAVVEDVLGTIELLVMNAAMSGPTGPVHEINPDECWRTVERNVRGPYLYARAVVSGVSGASAES